MQPWQHRAGGDGWCVPPPTLTAAADSVGPGPFRIQADWIRHPSESMQRSRTLRSPEILAAAGGLNRDSTKRSSRMAQNRFFGWGSTRGRIELLIRPSPPGGPQTDNNRRDQSGLDAALTGSIEPVAMGGICCPWRRQQPLKTSGLAPLQGFRRTNAQQSTKTAPRWSSAKEPKGGAVLASSQDLCPEWGRLRKGAKTTLSARGPLSPPF